MARSSSSGGGSEMYERYHYTSFHRVIVSRHSGTKYFASLVFFLVCLSYYAGLLWLFLLILLILAVVPWAIGVQRNKQMQRDHDARVKAAADKATLARLAAQTSTAQLTPEGLCSICGMYPETHMLNGVRVGLHEFHYPAAP